MRQYCSGGSRTWSSIHPLFGVCSSGWLRNKAKRPPGHEHPGHLRRSPRRGRRCARTRGRRRPRRSWPGERERGRAGPGVGRSPAAAVRLGDLRPGRVDADDHVGAPGPGQPGDLALAGADVEHRPRPGQGSAASGRICSTYSGSAPSVKPACHQPALRLPEVVAHRRGRPAPGRCTAIERRVVDALVHRLGHGVGQPRQRLQLLERRLLHRLHAAELLHQPLAPGRSPRPGMPSSTEFVVMRLPRSLRW